MTSAELSGVQDIGPPKNGRFKSPSLCSVPPIRATCHREAFPSKHVGEAQRAKAMDRPSGDYAGEPAKSFVSVTRSGLSSPINLT